MILTDPAVDLDLRLEQYTSTFSSVLVPSSFSYSDRSAGRRTATRFEKRYSGFFLGTV